MFNPELAEIRFGTGLSPRFDAPQSVDALLNGLVGRDDMARDFPIEAYDDFRLRVIAYQSARRDERRAKSDQSRKTAQRAKRDATKEARNAYARMFRNALLRRIHTTTGLRERLAFFWSDHFTAMGKSAVVRFGTSPYIEEAIRPHIAGKFEDMLIAAVTHPLMLHYLDQTRSVGPNSKQGQRRGAGLNENLAREVMELHTLGVDGPYTQKDVRELAELFTGLTVTREATFKFNQAIAEPGRETILGKTYGANPSLAEIKAALRDLARHPATARHVALKLARHFTSDTPAPDLVGAMTKAYQDSDGALLNVYVAMLDHPASWQTELANVKRPVDFMASGLRALDVDARTLKRSNINQLTNVLFTPLQIMGQPWEAPNGPDGWAEDNGFWITPQFMAARLAWALTAPQALMKTLPDPREFAVTALGAQLPREVAFAAKAAENKWEAIALVLTSPAFQKF